MNRARILTAAVSLMATLTFAVAGCASVDTSARSVGDISIAGTTRVDLVTVSAPAPANPTIDVTVGIATLQTPQAIAKRRAAAASRSQSTGPRPAGVLAKVFVRPGDHVKKGQLVAVLDDRMLRVGVTLAEAAYRKSVAQSGLMAANASDLRDQRVAVYDARTLLRTQQTLLTTQGSKLAGQATAMKAQVPQLEAALKGLLGAKAGLAAQLAQAEKAAQSPSPPPGIQQTIAGLQAAIGKVDAQIAQVSGAVAGIQAALPKMTGALVQITTGMGKMAQAKALIATGLAKMADGITQLEQTSAVIKIASRAQAAGIDLAQLALDHANMRSPVDGTVVSALPTGQVAMVGAPVVIIRPDTRVLVDAFLSPEQAVRVRAGDAATVTLDSIREPLRGTVDTIWPTAEFPPNSYPTPIVHLSNVVRVTVSVPATDLPMGVPADVVITPTR